MIQMSKHGCWEHGEGVDDRRADGVARIAEVINELRCSCNE